MTQLRKLTVIFWSLVVISVTLALLSNTGNRGARYNLNLPDSAAVTEIRLAFDDISHKLTEGSQGWMINDTLDADDNVLRIALTFIQDIKFRRFLSAEEEQEVGQWYDSLGVQLVLTGTDGVTDVKITPDPENNTTYLFTDDRWVEAYIPGYATFVGGIFYLSEGQWRSKELFSVSWLNLQSLIYRGSRGSTEIRYHKDFLQIAGIGEMDTTAMMAYVQQFQRFNVNQFLTEDEIHQADPNYEFFAADSIEVTALNGTSHTLIFSENRLNGFLIGRYRDEYFAVSGSRVPELFVDAAYFRRNEQM